MSKKLLVLLSAYTFVALCVVYYFDLKSPFFLGLRMAFHAAIAMIIAFAYRDPTAKSRPRVSMVAFLIAGSSAAECVRIGTHWNEFISVNIEPFLTIFVGAWLIPLVLAKGNVAVLFSPERRTAQ